MYRYIHCLFKFANTTNIKKNDIERIHSFKADPNISVIWNVGDWCGMITLTLQHHVGVFFGVGTVRYNPFLLRYSLIGPHTPSAIRMEPNKTRFTFQRGDCFLVNTYVRIYLAQFWEGVFFHPSFIRFVFFFNVLLGRFLSSNGVPGSRRVQFARHRSSFGTELSGFSQRSFCGYGNNSSKRSLKASAVRITACTMPITAVEVSEDSPLRFNLALAPRSTWEEAELYEPDRHQPLFERLGCRRRKS